MDEFRQYKQGRIHTHPRNLEIADIDMIYPSPGGLIISPTYYLCELFLSIHVINEIIQYAVKNNWVILKGSIIIPIQNRKVIINVSPEKENDAAQTSSSLSTPDAHS